MTSNNIHYLYYQWTMVVMDTKCHHVYFYSKIDKQIIYYTL